MFPTGGFTSLLSPDACQTAIDAVLYEAFDKDTQPSYLSSRDAMYFNIAPIDKMAFIWDEDSDVADFQETGDQEEILTENTFIGNQKTKRVAKYTKSVPISWEAFKTDQHGKRDRIGAQIGAAARRTQDKLAVQYTYGDAFAGSVNTTPDGQALASNSHVGLGTGSTIDNLETGVMNPDNMWTCTVSLGNQLGQNGEWGGQLFSSILTPLVLYKTAKEVLNSPLIANSGENNLNIFETDYGEISIKQTPYLGSAFNSNTNANTSYHLLSRNHMIMRKVLAEISTVMIPPENTRTDSYEMRARYAEVPFPGTWNGYVGCNGSAQS